MPGSPSTPPVPTTADGSLRRVGVELELSGVPVTDLVDLVREQFGGEVHTVSEFEHLVKDSEVGEFRIELDFEYLKAAGREPYEEPGLRAEVRRLSVEAVAEVARLLVPMEIVTPPLAPARLADLDALVERIRARGGLGTRHSAVYAFGLHLNPEVPSLTADVLLRYLRAFLCLYDWLVAVEQVDWSRRVTPYIDPYPRDYVLLVLDPGYRPDIARLIDDYLAHNAVRNRALDLLPLFAHIDEARVSRAVTDPRLRARPTFHYRLPNCDVDRPGWGVSRCWHNWLTVESLAEDAPRLEAIGAAYRAHLDTFASRFTRDWETLSRQWLA